MVVRVSVVIVGGETTDNNKNGYFSSALKTTLPLANRWV